MILLVLVAVVPAPPTLAVAIVLAGIVAIASPLGLKYIPLDGPQMAAASYLVALLTAGVAAWLTGDLTWSREAVVQELQNGSLVWAAQQGAYQVLKAAAPGAVGAPPKALPPAAAHITTT